MKLSLFLVSTYALLLSSLATALELSFSDKQWDGIKVPPGQQCQKFGGQNPSTPKLKVSGLPSGSDKLVLEFSDRDYKKMDNGGHGKISFVIKKPLTEIEVPSVAGHSFDLPPGFALVAAHRSPGWDKAGAYMPPCSGGKGHAYYVTVKAIKNGKVAAESSLEMGKF